MTRILLLLLVIVLVAIVVFITYVLVKKFEGVEAEKGDANSILRARLTEMFKTRQALPESEREWWDRQCSIALGYEEPDDFRYIIDQEINPGGWSDPISDRIKKVKAQKEKVALEVKEKSRQINRKVNDKDVVINPTWGTWHYSEVKEYRKDITENVAGPAVNIVPQFRPGKY